MSGLTSQSRQVPRPPQSNALLPLEPRWGTLTSLRTRSATPLQPFQATSRSSTCDCGFLAQSNILANSSKIATEQCGLLQIHDIQNPIVQGNTCYNCSTNDMPFCMITPCDVENTAPGKAIVMQNTVYSSNRVGHLIGIGLDTIASADYANKWPGSVISSNVIYGPGWFGYTNAVGTHSIINGHNANVIVSYQPDLRWRIRVRLQGHLSDLEHQRMYISKLVFVLFIWRVPGEGSRWDSGLQQHRFDVMHQWKRVCF